MNRLLAGLLLALLSCSAIAGPVASVGGGKQRINGSNFGIAYFGLGYQFDTGSQWSFVPEVRYGFRVSSDPNLIIFPRLDEMVSLNLRGQLNLGRGYLFVQPNLTHVKVDAGGAAAANPGYDIGWSSGIGFGAGFQMVRWASVEASVERVSGADFYSIGFRFHF